jgi:hypothetical protein
LKPFGEQDRETGNCPLYWMAKGFRYRAPFALLALLKFKNERSSTTHKSDVSQTSVFLLYSLKEPLTLFALVAIVDPRLNVI